MQRSRGEAWQFGDSPLATLGDERRATESVSIAESAPFRDVPMDAERIAALQAACVLLTLAGELATIPARSMPGHVAALRAILRDAGADD